MNCNLIITDNFYLYFFDPALSFCKVNVIKGNLLSPFVYIGVTELIS